MIAGAQALRALGQSLWLDAISRRMLDDGTLAALIADFGVTGLTSNPTIFAEAMTRGGHYDASIASLAREGHTTEDLFFALALEDLRRAADLLRPAHEASGGADGWVSLELAPGLQHDAAASVEAARRLHALAARRNLFIKIPGTPEGMSAIEEAVFRGVPVNVTLLFSCEQAMAATEACLRGLEGRIADGLPPDVDSVVSLFVSRWDAAVRDDVPPALRNRLGLAVARRTYAAWRCQLAGERWRRVVAAGARPTRLLWASTGTKDPAAPATLYADALAAPGTIDTLPEKTLRALADATSAPAPMPEDGGDAEAVLAQFRGAGVDLDALALKLQKQGGDAFAKSWDELMKGLAERAFNQSPGA